MRPLVVYRSPATARPGDHRHQQQGEETAGQRQRRVARRADDQARGGAAPAPARAIRTSTEPWVLARVASGVESTISVVPLISPRFQPRPRSTRASVSRPRESPGARAETTPAQSSVTPDAAAMGSRPTRSTRGPVTSEGRNIAPMCMPMTNPTSPRLWWCSRMCTGVIVMIATIAIWVSTITVAPTATPRAQGSATGPGTARTGTDPVGSTAGASSGGAAASSCSASARATWNGSGRRNARRNSPASPNATAESRKGPASAGMPSRTASSPSTSTELGPATAPNVVATNAIDTAVPRDCSGARSVPAYRACRLVAVPAP